MKRSLVIFLLVLFLFLPVSAQEKIRDLKPTVVLISIDGFRASYFDSFRPPNIRKLAEKGVRAKWMIPSFPTKTFPNHYTIATGLYPAHHGIVGNNIYDPVFDAVFGLGKREEVENPRWWQGEPIWVTAEKQGQFAGTYFFPGTATEIAGVRPKFWKVYDGKVPNEERVDTVLTWFDLPVAERPTLFTMYFSDVDDAGHRNSPDSKEAKEAVLRVDSMVGRLVNGLKKRGVDKQVNIILVSDHGMAAVPNENAVIVDEMFDTSLARQILWVDEFTQIWPKEGNEEAIYSSLKSKLPPQIHLYRKSEIPERYHYRGNRRIAPIILSPDPGWLATTRERYERMKAREGFPSVTGSHGYDNMSVEMRALFVARGASFKRRFVAEPFSNVEVYNVMCRILGLTPAPNDGDLDHVKMMLLEN